MKVFVESLQLSYVWDGERGLAVFEDGVSYGVGELLILCLRDTRPEDLQAVHLVKKHFDGVLFEEPPKVDYSERVRKHIDYWFETGYISPEQKRRHQHEISRRITAPAGHAPGTD